MKEAPEREKFRELLLHERNRLRELREGLEESFRVLQQLEREFEVNAHKKNFSFPLEELDTLGTDEATDRALGKTEKNYYFTRRSRGWYAKGTPASKRLMRAVHGARVAEAGFLLKGIRHLNGERYAG
jgi:hypothetical protein